MLSNFNFWNYLSKDSPQNKVVEPDDQPIAEEKPVGEIDNDKFSNSDKAKEWANYLLEVGKSATSKAAKQVSCTAKQLRQNVSGIGIIEESNIIVKFSDEQTKFKEEKRLIEKKTRETCLPWMDALSDGDSDQQILKTKIMLISSDERNFVRNPPSGSGFEFNYELHTPVANLLLGEDLCLAKMRYKLVPKRISEEVFWRNYFYRVFLIKQSLQQDIEINDGDLDVQDESKDNYDAGVAKKDSKEEISKQEITGSKLKNEVKKKEEIKVTSSDNDDLEAELQKELSEFELINEDNGQENVVADDQCEYDDLEREILNELREK